MYNYFTHWTRAPRISTREKRKILKEKYPKLAVSTIPTKQVHAMYQDLFRIRKTPRVSTIQRTMEEFTNEKQPNVPRATQTT